MRWRVVWIARLVLVLVTIGLFLGVLELSLRMFGPILPGNYTSGAYLERHPIYGFFHIPGYQGWQHSSEYLTRVNFSQIGLRDLRTSYAKPLNTFRILLLGDSFMEGVQVEQQETTAAVLEARLRALRPDLNVEVIDAGVAGWGTGIEWLYLDQDGYKFEPDLVLVSFFIGNDLYDNYYKLQLAGDVDDVERDRSSALREASRPRAEHRRARQAGQQASSSRRRAAHSQFPPRGRLCSHKSSGRYRMPPAHSKRRNLPTPLRQTPVRLLLSLGFHASVLALGPLALRAK